MIGGEWNALLSLTDYVIMCFRRDLKLWFDINTHLRSPKCLNDAELGDGASYAWAWFSMEDFPGSTTTLHAGSGAAYMYASLREDSRMKLDNAEETFRDLAIKAETEFSALPKDKSVGTRIALLALQVSQRIGDSNTRGWIDLIASRLGAKAEDWPGYSGLLADDPAFEMIEDREQHWVQLALSDPVEGRVAAGVLAPYLLNAAALEPSSNRTYLPSPLLKSEFGISGVRILTRRY